MPDDLYFEGDPELDSRRRHLERVLKGEPPRRKWPWVLALLAGGGAWAIWRAGKQVEQESAATKETDRKSR
jgi:hypothetical protein